MNHLPRLAALLASASLAVTPAMARSDLGAGVDVRPIPVPPHRPAHLHGRVGAVAPVAGPVINPGTKLPFVPTPDDYQTMINSEPWVNGRGLINGPTFRDNYQALHDLISGMGTWVNGRFLPGNPPAVSYVSNAIALVNDTNYATPAYSVASKAVYVDTGAHCTAADLGWQVQPVDFGHCWQTDISKGAPITVWGGVDDDVTDNQPAGVRALAALGVAHAPLVIPSTSGCFRFNSTLSIGQPGLSVVGSKGGGSCVDRGFAGGHLLSFHDAPDLGAYDLTIRDSVPGGPLDTDVEFANAPFGHAERLVCGAGHWFCIGYDGQGPYFTRDNFISADGQAAFAFGCQNAATPADITIDGADIAYQHRAAFEMCNVSGLYISHVNTDFNLHNIWAHPNAGQQVAAVYTTQTFFDVSSDIGVLLDGSNGGQNGTISEWVMDPTTWLASSGIGVPDAFAGNLRSPMPVNAQADALYIAAPSAGATNVVDNEFFGHIFGASRNGIFYAGGVNNQFGGISTQNCIRVPDSDTTNNCAGLAVAVGVVGWSWNGAAGPLVQGGGGNHQRWGVYAPNNDMFSISGDMQGNQNGPVFDGLGFGPHKSFTQVPALPWRTGPSSLVATGGTLGTSTGTMRYTVQGNTVMFSASYALTTNGTGGGVLRFPLPGGFPTTDDVQFNVRTGSATVMTNGLLSGFANHGESLGNLQTQAGAYPGVDGLTVTISGQYQTAP